MAQTMELWHTTKHYHKSKSYSLESFILCVVREQIGFTVRSQRRMGIAAPRTSANSEVYYWNLNESLSDCLILIKLIQPSIPSFPTPSNFN